MTQPTTSDERPAGWIPDEHFTTGPEVGEVIPDFTLPDQRGNRVTLSEARGRQRALLVFHRSVRW